MKILRRHRLQENMIGEAVDVQGEPSLLERAPAEARAEYICHMFAINAPHDVSAELEHFFNFSVQGDADLIETVQNQIRNIFQQQNVSFRLNFAVGMILQNIETEEYRYFFSISQQTCFPITCNDS